MAFEEAKSVAESAQLSKLFRRSCDDLEQEVELLLQKCCESVSSKMMERVQAAARDIEWSSSIRSLKQSLVGPLKRAVASEALAAASTASSEQHPSFAADEPGASPEAPPRFGPLDSSQTFLGVHAAEISNV
eukprot:TRINITY_DN17641_c0_g1_i1.p1 TRINITY_DN17641_c0_g1~~TRINITY_DN17641_c0_g1_i1.p1  ORF type:complete len:153 (-),score=30.39 TRINITY_DN17641_c0_g1_i1:1-396(-)